MSRRTASVGLLILCFIGASPLTAQAQATSCKSTVTGTLEVVPLQSHAYGDNRTLRVWLPAGYFAPANSSKRYPVLYIFDGQDLFDRCTARRGEDEWHVDEALTDLIAKRTVQPLIVVGVDNAGPGRREDEYSSYGAMSDAPQKLSAFMMREALPLIDGRYRTIADRTHRGVGGAPLQNLRAVQHYLVISPFPWRCLRC